MFGDLWMIVLKCWIWLVCGCSWVIPSHFLGDWVASSQGYPSKLFWGYVTRTLLVSRKRPRSIGISMNDGKEYLVSSAFPGTSLCVNDWRELYYLVQCSTNRQTIPNHPKSLPSKKNHYNIKSRDIQGISRTSATTKDHTTRRLDYTLPSKYYSTVIINYSRNITPATWLYPGIISRRISTSLSVFRCGNIPTNQIQPTCIGSVTLVSQVAIPWWLSLLVGYTQWLSIPSGWVSPR